MSSLRTFWVFCTLLCAASLASAADYYISPCGNDSAGGERNQPLRSFSRAVALLEPGDALHLAAGRYGQPMELTALRGTQ